MKKEIVIDREAVEAAMRSCDKKVIQTYGRRILRHFDPNRPKSVPAFSFKSEKCLNEIMCLAGYLFIFEKFDLCYDVCEILDCVVFSNNYRLWNYVRKCRMLKCAISRMRGDEESAQKELDVIRPYDHPDLYENQWFLVQKAIEGNERNRNDPMLQKFRTGADEEAYQVAQIAIFCNCNEFIQKNALPHKQLEIQKTMDWCRDYIRKNAQ